MSSAELVVLAALIGAVGIACFAAVLWALRPCPVDDLETAYLDELIAARDAVVALGARGL